MKKILFLLVMAVSFGEGIWDDDVWGGYDDHRVIMGKVFYDKNRNGIQDNNSIEGITIKNLYSEKNIVGDVVIETLNEDEPKIIDQKKANKKITVPNLLGDNTSNSKVMVDIFTEEKTDINISTSNCGDYTLTKNDSLIQKGKKKSKYCDNFKIKRTIENNNGNTTQILELSNDAPLEYGLPGVVVYSPQGVKAITDKFGRYSMPVDTVFNMTVKIDENSLPMGNSVSENPIIHNVGNYNFAVFF